MRNPIITTVLLAALAASTAGCWAVSPQLDPHDPPPNIEPGLLLLEIPEGVVEALSTDLVFADRDRVLGDDDGPTARHVRAHRIVTGMTAQHVIWVFGAHPTGVRDQGPPGGHTLLWELPRGIGIGRATVGNFEDDGSGNYWVRLDGRGLVVAAGRN